MASIAQSGSHAVAPVFGLLMVGSAAVGSHGPAIIAAVAAVIAVAVGTVVRAAATLAVLLSVSAIALSDRPHVLAALSGLCAAAYLVCRHGAGATAGLVMGSSPTIIAAAGFTFVGLVATSFPLQLPWLPLVAPLAVLAIYVLATRPYLG
ncbi:hypothetical protein [Mycobacterium riyadhense]|uniref:Integral membrane protein n=1 Tax=Mycobacterium riyadhense TaxID=486698 RepID=A0A1X2D6I8_9MYCO|nr:hypothetical protein [Mycobacterium riyadhense]MCV7148125.1 hypothetical protein [Mycobacterium riyadhense]ORW83785.1 hypothetical protein AWC22_14785 [Mycobacterium riyadhense]VTO95671.1 hypothetical protein BIN_B_01153 [Mycobacterium riyadhense]